MKLLLPLIAILLPFFLAGQEVTPEYMAQIQGVWDGTLTYTDYSDDKKQVSLKTKLTANWKGEKGELSFEYIEPNGEIVSSKEKIKVSKDRKKFLFDGDWKIKSFNAIETNASWTMILEKQGKDNNQEATLRQEVKLTPTQLEINKLVRYTGTEEFFQRNRYLLTRN